MESYEEWRVTVYDVIFGVYDVIFGDVIFGFLIVTPLNYPNYIENQI